ncbi:Crp/Fnr family transcriptional regulator [Rhodocytophaga aerolata]|uniref:Crp/Fnr family transcriptional regulator n=1 Tax=Rhodocytophaga aerolata TaxID=455078 RepID=UPI0034593D40
MYERLFEHLLRYIHLEAGERAILLSHLQLKKLSRKEFLLKEGQVCSGMYFVIEGCLRLYSITEKGSEQILQFGIENWWISDYLSFENKLPSP